MKVELKEIHKFFGPVHANDGVTLSAQPGTLHGLLGENGAGKSTLMKVLSGFLSPDSGEILLDGKSVSFESPARAVELGVGMLHQDPLDFPALSVIDNFLLGSTGRWRLDRSRFRRELVDLLTRFDFQFDPDALVSDLSIGERQQLEIARLLWLGVRVLILDEPTTAISAQQRAKLFSALRQLTEEGKTVIFVSHKLEEVTSLCSKVTVLSHGKVTGEATMPCPTDRLVQMMFGQCITVRKRSNVDLGEPVLEIDHLAISDWRVEVKDFSLSVCAGEVIGLAGLEGSGQHLVIRASAGLLFPEAGRIRVGARDMTGQSYHRFLDAGIIFMPAGRLEEGLIAGMTWTEHAALVERASPFWVDWPRAARKAAQCIQEFNIKAKSSMCVEELSGGNQQRTLLALIPPHPPLLLMEHPTRGLDIESTESIWGLLLDWTRSGTAIVFSSSDLDELLDRSDRILVFFNGRVRALDARRATVEQLGELIGGKGFN
jgi:general nucleoside transport system ATP-binding protein